ncbi:MAG: hypothetical protein GY759_00780 [Chloroflexi bacterium]|nr:hypothetical protein [Chloroflexota bacterium]
MARARDKGEKGGSKNVARTADAPGQALNVDLCFVPATHENELKLPAVSGSSGRLVVERSSEREEERQWPGQVFADESLDYSEAMLEFVNASRAENECEKPAKDPEEAEKESVRARKRAIRQEEEDLRKQRRAVREQRKLEDAAWQTLKTEQKQQQATPSALTSQGGKAQDEQWRAQRQQRRESTKQRKQEDEDWRQQRLSIRERLSLLPIVKAWIAILVITDNCTRQCLGLPLFVAGPNVTAEMVVEALRALLPPELLFLISDRGVHFTAGVFQELMRSEEFIHVLIARHRPQSKPSALYAR